MPRAACLICLTILIATTGASAGTIIGTVKAKGAPLDETSTENTGGYQSRRYKFAEKIDYDRLTDFVVYIDEPLASVTPAGTTSVAITTQRNAIFDGRCSRDRKSTRLNSSHLGISYAVFCLKK